MVCCPMKSVALGSGICDSDVVHSLHGVWLETGCDDCGGSIAKGCS